MPAKIGFVSLGCPKATVDSERILTRLRTEGYMLASTYADADLVVVNTCGFIDEAVAESLETIGEALADNGKVIVTGCLGAREDTIRHAHPSVLAVTGPDQLEQVMEAVHTHLPRAHEPFEDLVPPGGIKLTPRHYAYLKIAEGCNQKCSFCIIPTMRGPLLSRPVGALLDEAERLVDAGVRELLVVAQDTAAYGVDTRYRTDFRQGRPLKTRIHELARHLGRLEAWVRLHYVYPYPHVDALVELMAEEIVLPYLDVPLQHASPPVLKAMRRPADTENMLRRIEHWRAVCPQLVLRSTFIVGFPGETEDDFETLLEFLEAAQLDRVGAFPYSAVTGAVANELPGVLSEAEKQARLQRFMEVQNVISFAKQERRIGQRTAVLVDEVAEDTIIGRTYAEAPEIDGVVIMQNREDLDIQAGDFLEVELFEAEEHDLYGEILE